MTKRQTRSQKGTPPETSTPQSFNPTTDTHQPLTHSSTCSSRTATPSILSSATSAKVRTGKKVDYAKLAKGNFDESVPAAPAYPQIHIKVKFAGQKVTAAPEVPPSQIPIPPLEVKEKGSSEPKIRKSYRHRHQSTFKEPKETIEIVREADLIFHKWAKEETLFQTHTLTNLKYAEPDQQLVIKKRVWVRESIRGGYKVFVQICPPRKLGERAPGSNCEHPLCFQDFITGQYRVSVEPGVWTQPIPKYKKPGTSQSEVLLDKETEKLALPKYGNLSSTVNPSKYGKNGFFCLHCFENLLEPVDHVANQDARTPGLSSRIYSLVFPENRVAHSNPYMLDKLAEELIRHWKQVNYDEGIRQMEEKFDFLGNDMTWDEKKRNEGIKPPQFDIVPGMSLADVFDLAKFKDSEIWRRIDLYA